MNLGNTALLGSAAALLVTKALDVHSTWHHVGVEGELNPIVRRWFRRFGLVRGLSLACVVYVVVLAVELGFVWWLDNPVLTWGTVVLGAFVSLAQWDVARFNRTRIHSWFTRFTMRFYLAWNGRIARYASREPSKPLPASDSFPQ